MINLLSNEEKTQIKFSKYNSVILIYVVFAAIAAIVLCLLVFGAGLYSKRIADDITAEKELILEEKKEFDATISEAKLVGEDLKIIESLYNSDPKYSEQIVAISKTLDPETKITTLELSPFQQGVLELQIIAKNRDAIFRLRNHMVQSELFDFADIVSITPSIEDSYTAEIAVRYVSTAPAPKVAETKKDTQ